MMHEQFRSESRKARDRSRRFTFFGFPLRIRGGHGSPVRAIAMLDDKCGRNFPPASTQEIGERPKRGFRDVVLDTLGVGFRGFRRDADGK